MIQSSGKYPKDCQRCGKLETNCKSLLASSGPDSFVWLFATTMQKENSNPKEQGKKQNICTDDEVYTPLPYGTGFQKQNHLPNLPIGGAMLAGGYLTTNVFSEINVNLHELA